MRFFRFVFRLIVYIVEVLWYLKWWLAAILLVAWIAGLFGPPQLLIRALWIALSHSR